MSDTRPGVVIVTTFCGPDAGDYGSYTTGYMDRSEAIGKDKMRENAPFSAYMDYMGNPDKTLGMDEENPEKESGLFTKEKDALDTGEIADLKAVYQDAQRKGSLLWKTVISFDNDWLEEMHVMDQKTGIVDEKRLRNAARSAIETLLEKEDLQNGVWAASFHYNTDNVHLHISTVEPEPQRKKKLYRQYETVTIKGKTQYRQVEDPKSGKKRRVPVRDADGNFVFREEYVGRFKTSSHRAAKSRIVSELAFDQELNREINDLIRQRMVGSVRAHSLVHDAAFRDAFLAIYEKLPENRGVCNYNNSAMARLRPEIDDLSLLYIKTYHEKEYAALKAKLERQSAIYQRAYGNSDQNFQKNKEADLMARMGNAILKEMLAYDKAVKQDAAGGERKESEERRQRKGQDAAMHSFTPQGRHLQSALYWLRRSLEESCEAYLNQRDYEALQAEIGQELENE